MDLAALALDRAQQQVRAADDCLRLAREMREHPFATPDTISLRSIISELSRGGPLTGDVADKLRERALRGGAADFDPMRPSIPWDVLRPERRDLTVAAAGAGGYLVGADTDAARDVLAPWSVVARAGCTIASGLRASLTVPVVLTPPVPVALPTEATATTEASATLGQRAMTPKTLSVIIDISRQLMAQAASAEQFLRMVLGSAIARFLDRQVLNGSGASGELLGVFNTPGIGTQSGTSLSHAGATTMAKLSREADAADDDLAFVATPAVRALLEARERASGSGFVWDGDKVADVRAYSTTSTPTASMVVGPWSQCVVGLWGPGFEFALNPNDPAGFKTGIVQARLMLSVDCVFVRPSAFVIASSIT